DRRCVNRFFELCGDETREEDSNLVPVFSVRYTPTYLQERIAFRRLAVSLRNTEHRILGIGPDYPVIAEALSFRILVTLNCGDRFSQQFAHHGHASIG